MHQNELEIAGHNHLSSSSATDNNHRSQGSENRINHVNKHSNNTHNDTKDQSLLQNKESHPHLESESRFTFFEATSVIIGHGVGAGILSVPFFASVNSWWSFLLILGLVYLINLLMHFMIAELSYNNGGLQFIKCLERELFIGRFKNIISYTCFSLLLVSVIMNVAGYISGGGDAFHSWLGIPVWVGKLLFYILAASVVYVGMKLVGICEKFAVSSMFIVVGILLVAIFLNEFHLLPTHTPAFRNALALYSLIAFSLSAVMSVPQVVKGLDGDIPKIRASIALGTALNLLLIAIITFMTLLGAEKVTQRGALVDLSQSLGGWVAIVGYLFTLLALATSFWANTLNLRDIVAEQTKFNLKLSWLLASLPCLIVAMIGTKTFVGFIQLAAAIQVVTGIGIIVAYNRSRKKSDNPGSICGYFGALPWQILVVLGSIIATIGSFIKVVL